MSTELDSWYPPAGDCCCGKDARHRLLGEVCAAIAASGSTERVAAETGLPHEAVVATVKWWDPEQGRPKEAG